MHSPSILVVPLWCPEMSRGRRVRHPAAMLLGRFLSLVMPWGSQTVAAATR